MKLLYRIQVIAMTFAMIFCISNIFLMTKTYARTVASQTTIKIAEKDDKTTDSDDDLMTIDDSNSKKVYQANSTVNGITSKILKLPENFVYIFAALG